MNQLCRAAALTCFLSGSALAQPTGELTSYAQRGVVIPARTIRVGVSGHLNDARITSSFVDQGRREEEVNTHTKGHFFLPVYWSPGKDIEIGAGLAAFHVDEKGTDPEAFSFISIRGRLVSLDEFELALTGHMQSHLAIGLSMRGYLTPCTHIELTTSIGIGFALDDHNHLRSRDLVRVPLYLGVAHNFFPNFYGKLAFDSLFDLTHEYHHWGGSAGLGYTFSRKGSAFIDLEAVSRFRYLFEDTVNGLDNIRWLNLGLNVNVHF